MKYHQVICLSVLVVIGFCSSATADELQPIPSAISPQPSVTLHGDVESWRHRAQAWYTSSETIDRRKQMREMSRPLKRPCYYCHTRNFKDYVESTYLISLQMMAVSAEQNVKCKDCHQGQRGLTDLGAKALIQWRYSVAKQKDCATCHEPQGQFKKLTVEGQASILSLIHELERGKYLKGIPQSVTIRFLEQLKNGLREKNK